MTERSQSPFHGKKEESFQREQSFWEKTSGSVGAWASESFVKAIPSDEIKQMPTRYMYGFGGALLLSLVGIFVALVSTGYMADRSKVFLSPLEDQTEASPNCKTIEVSNTGTYLGTTTGYWQGQAGFDFSLASFEVSMTSFAMSSPEYTSLLTQLYGLISFVGDFTSTQNLGVNLLCWFSYTAVPIPSNTAQRFNFIGDPLVVFNRQQVIGTIGGVSGVCNATSTSRLDLAQGYLISTFSYNEYAEYPLCQNSLVAASVFGYIPGVNDNTFSINVDVRTLITGISVHYGILFFDQLVEIAAYRNNFNYSGTVYNTSGYYNPKFAGMRPLVCITSTSIQQCIIRVNDNLYALPIYNHLGNSTELPQQCICEYMTAEEKQNSYDPCNLFRFIVGFIFYDSPSPDILFSLALTFEDNLIALNNAAFNASFVTSYWGQTSPMQDELNSEAARKAAFDFCYIEGQYCQVMTFSLFDQIQNSWAISEYYYQLNYGACQDAISIPQNIWDQFIEYPFAPLLQSYQKCQSSPTTTFTDQVGIQIGNLSVATPIVVVFFIGVVLLYQWFFRIDIPLAYTKKEKDDALEALAISLLLARDRRATLLRKRQKMKDRNRRRAAKPGAAVSELLRDSTVNDDDNRSRTTSFADSVSPSRSVSSADSSMNSKRDPSAATGGDSSELQFDENDVCWRLVDALERDAVFHQDVYQLKQEMIMQQRAENEGPAINWSGVKAAAKNRIAGGKRRLGFKGQKSPESAETLFQRGTRYLSASLRRSSAQAPTDGTGESKTGEATVPPFHGESEAEGGGPAIELSTVPHTTVANPMRSITILNRRPAGTSSKSSTVFSDREEIKDMAFQLISQLEAVSKAMNVATTLSQEQESQQQYWTVVGEITFFITSVQLPDDSEARDTDLFSLLARLLELHAACSLNVTPAVVRVQHARTVGYKFYGRRVLSLQELIDYSVVV